MSLALGAVVLIALIAAALHPGLPATAVDLNDEGVWVTNARLQMVAHLNHASRSLDAAIRTDSKSVDVFQNGDQVEVADLDAATLAPVDVARARLGAAVGTPGMSSAVGGEVAAFTHAQEGKVWRQRVAQLAPIDLEGDEPELTDLPGAVTVVGRDGAIHAVSAEAARVVTLPADADAKRAVSRELAGLASDAVVQVTAVGDEAVVLDRSTGTVHLPGGASQRLEGTNFQLQEAGPEDAAVLVATAQGLHEIPLTGAQPVFRPVANPGGTPARPVRLGACAYSAWAGHGAFLRDCRDDAEDVDMAVPSLAGANQPKFRVNRQTIVLNDTESGSLWLPNEMMLLVDDWDQINSSLESEEESDEESADQANEIAEPERAEENTPPVAADDTFGVRAGRGNILPVIQNDSDSDGDFMTITQVTGSTLGELSITRGGGALHLQVPAGATGSGTFEYEIHDGRGGVDRAQVEVTVHGDEINSPPEQLSPQEVSLGAGRSATINALANWYDPDGDPFYLAGARSPEGLSVRYRELGSLDVAENGATTGRYDVALEVSDGRAVGEGTLEVTVRDAGNLPPVPNTDHVVVPRGSAVTISPLDNDTDPNGDSLRLVQLEAGLEGVEAAMDGTLGTATITGRTVGSYYLSYVVTDGPAAANGYIRVDVVEPDSGAPPTAADDIGVLPLGGQALIDLLANDYDASGGVLTVTGIDVPAGSPLTAALLNRQVIRVTTREGLTAPATLSYTVSNGVATATASVTVVPGEPVDTTQPPELTDDKVVVRSGDVANVSVLDNDRSPVGLSLTVTQVQHNIPADVATIFQSDNTLRIRGGATGGSGSLIYTARDTAGNVASAAVEFTVLPVDEEANTAPRPRNLVARTAAGHSVDIPVPLDGIDLEGDSVVLLGIASSPKLGTVELKGNAFTYTASPEAVGTDTFSYLVEDRLGRQATGNIRVGIAPAAEVNQDPLTMPDQVEVRPNTRVSVAVLANDVDPDGDQISLVPGSGNDHGAGLQLGQRGSRITLIAPQEEGTHLVTYAVADGVGGQAEGLLTVIVDADVELKAPIARDDALTQDQVNQARAEGRIVVPVLENDEDPDGDIGEAEITSHDDTMRPVAGGAVEITLLPTPQSAIYTITDPTGLSASAIIRVPGLEQVRPTLDTANLPLRVKAGEVLTIPINDYVIARDDREVILTSEGTVTAGLGADGSPLVVDRTTLAFRSTPEFAGATSITFEVTDGTSLNDPEGRTAVLSLPIEVEAAANRPPTFRPTGVEVSRAAEGVTVDLAPMAADPDDDPLTFAVSGSAPAGITASVTGTTLTVKAGEEAQVGAVGNVPITVSDGQGGSIQAGVPVTVTDSTTAAPLLVVTGANVSMGMGGSAEVDVTAHAVSAAGADGPVRLVGQPVTSPGGSASVSGTVITLRADAGFTGTFTTTYVVVDGDGAPSRQVTGVITATVLDRPAPPTAVGATATTPTTARVSWTAGAANGSPITGFKVIDHTQGDTVECGLVTSCLLTGRTPGVTHEFSVQASNAVGVSDESARAQVHLDTVPGRPVAPTIVVGNGQAVVTWSAPVNDGSPILHYEVQVSPGFQVVERATGASTQSATVTGLTNGAEYVARVRAVNAQGASEWSQESVPVRPFGPPGRVSGVTAAMSTSFGSATGAVTVSWAQPAANGRPIEYYTVAVGGISRKVPAVAGTTATVEGVPLDGSKLPVSVTATNDATRPAGFTSEPGTTQVWAVGVPNPPSIQAVAATGNDGEVRLDWSPSAPGGGWRPSELTYEWSAGGDWAPLGGSVLQGNGLTNGTSSTISIRAVGSKTGSAVRSSAVTSGQVTPYGPPVASTMTCTAGPGTVNCHWGGGHGNGRAARFVLSGAESGAVSASGSRSFAVAPGTTVELCVTTTQTETGVSLPAQCDKATAAGSTRSIVVSTDGLNVTMTLTNFDTPGRYKVRCWNARSAEEARWPHHSSPGNWLGYADEVMQDIPSNGTVSFTCTGNPVDPGMRPDSNFSIELVQLAIFVR